MFNFRRSRADVHRQIDDVFQQIDGVFNDLDDQLDADLAKIDEAVKSAPAGATTTTRTEETRPDGTRIVTTTTVTKIHTERTKVIT